MAQLRDSDETAPATGLTVTPGDYGFPPGTLIGRYVLQERLGAGGMGVVYAAHDPKLGRRVALKLLRPDASGSPEAQGQLLREARTLARLAHPNVVTVHDIGEIDDFLYVAMELVNGTTLGQWLGARERSWQDVLEVFLQAGRGLAAAHAIGIVHRDFKPDNVLVGDDGRVRVVDFGIALLGPHGARAPSSVPPAPIRVDSAQQGETTAPPLTKSNLPPTSRTGTPRYMAPEHLNDGKADVRSDQYSYCVALKEGVTGRRPPRWLEEAIERGLSEAPGDRHPSMDALLEVLASAPRRRRRMARTAMATVAGVTLLAAGAVFGSTRHGAGTASSCRGAEAELAGIWDDARKADIERSFQATGKPFAADAWRAVHGTLDAYARDWVTERTDACEATSVRKEQSTAMLDQRMQCLDRHLAQSRVLLDVFAHADGDVVEHAVQAANGLAPVSECTAARLSEGKGQGDADPAISEMIGRATALQLAGKYEQAHQVAHEALDAARKGERHRQEAEALYTLGSIAKFVGGASEYQALLFDALVAAQRAGADRLVARAAIDLAGALADAQKTQDADRWLGLASAVIDRLGGDAALEAAAASMHAWNLYQAGELREAAEEQRRGLRIEEGLPPDPLRTAGSLNVLAGALYDLDEMDAAEDTIRKALHLDESTLGPEHPRTGTVLTNLGRILTVRGRYEDARAVQERGLAIAERLGGSKRAIAASSLGYTLAHLGRYEDARRNLDHALTVASADPSLPAARLSRIYVHFGYLERLQGHSAEAIKDYRRAVQLTPSGPHEAADAQLGLGRVYLEQRNARDAQSALERALALREKQTLPFELAETRLALAQALWMTGHDPARAKQLEGQAREFYTGDPTHEDDVKEIEAWLDRHGASAAR